MEGIYARQSVDKLDSLSIESQIEQCRKFSSGDVEIYQDKGFSGKNTNRPAFQRLMEDVEAGKISKIYAEAYINGKLCAQATLNFMLLGETSHV